MNQPPFEVADIIRQYGNSFITKHRSWLTWLHLRVLYAIAVCRTATLGGHLDRCSRCGHEAISYCSCRNRHCPKCQTNARDKWLAERNKELLPVSYVHVVFTLPHELSWLALQNKKVVYDLLFRTSATTLLEIAADPKHLGAEIGFLAILHTWGQNLQHHPHVHCVVPGGGLAPDGSRWIACRPGFFLPVRVRSRVFRGKFLALLRSAFERGRLSFHGKLAPLANPREFQLQLAASARTEWVVYAKPPWGGPEQVLKYLSRYTHRVAISNQRLVDLENGDVRFHWKDYAHQGATKTMKLKATEFIRRFLLHVLPLCFVRIRHYGFLANRVRQEKLALCRLLLNDDATPESISIANETVGARSAANVCPSCGKGLMVVEGPVRPTPTYARAAVWSPPFEPAGFDTS
jgi:hypothetical protein